MQTFPIPPADGKGAWILIGAIILLLGVTALLGRVIWSTKHSRVEVGEGQMRLVGDLWGRRIPVASLRLDDARIVDLRSEPSLQPRRRTMGTGLPGFAAGWFRLRNSEKALVYLSDRSRVVYLPTNENYAVLVSSHEPERLLEALRSEARR